MRTVEVTDELQAYLDGLVPKRDQVLARINGRAKVGTLPVGNNSLSNPYRPNLLGSCCYKGQNTTAPEYVLRP